MHNDRTVAMCQNLDDWRPDIDPLPQFQARWMATISGQLRLSLFQSDFTDVRDIQSQGTAQDPRYLS